MAENTRLKELQVDIKRLMEIMEKRNQDYTARMDLMESTLTVLVQNKSASGSSSGIEGTTQKQPFQVRNIKLDFPRFDGTDVLQWIFKAEQFFDYYGTPDEQRLTIAGIHMEKDVIPWFQMMSRNHLFQSWLVFTRALELEFGHSPYECPRSNLFKLTQIGNVNEFYLEFTTLANRVYGLSSDALLDCFLSGLKPDIRRDVIAQSPISLLKVVSFAKLFEEKYNSKYKSYYSTFNPRFPNTNPQTRNTTLPPLLPTPPVKPLNQNPNNTNIKRMTSTEMQLRREKSLYYTYDDKFTPAHKCPNKQLLILQVEDEEQEPEPPELNDLQITNHNLKHHLSYNALKGANGLGTMKFQGSINGVTL